MIVWIAGLLHSVNIGFEDAPVYDVKELQFVSTDATGIDANYVVRERNYANIKTINTYVLSV